VRRRNSAVAMQRLQRFLFSTTDSRRNPVVVVDAEAAFEACSYFANDVDSGKLTRAHFIWIERAD